MKIPRSLVCIGVGALFSAGTVLQATPYASGVTVSGGTVNWHLNESVTNGVVAYLFNVNGNSYAASNYVGGTQALPVNAGPQSFSLNSYTNFQIYVYSVGTGSPHQISPSPGTGAGQSPLTAFYGPRGVGVNRNPNSSHFGTVYVCNASGGNAGPRTTAQGLFAVNADFTDAFGYGATEMPPTGSGAGQLNVTGVSTTYGLWRVFVGPDDMVYVSGGGTLAVGGGVWMCTPNLSTATDLFPFNANTSAAGQYVDDVSTPVVTGSYAAGTLNLYTTEWNRSGSAGYNEVWQYQFYSTLGTPITLPYDPNATPPNEFPISGSCVNSYTGLANFAPGFVDGGIASVNTVISDFYIAPDGKFYVMEERGTAAGNTTLWVFDTPANGSCLLWDSYDASGATADPLVTAYSTCVSPDDQYVALGCSSASGVTANNGQILVMALDTQPNAEGTTSTGLPDLTTLTRIQYGTGDNSLRGTAWDAADNVYCVSGSDDSMRCFTLGITATCITGNDTTGTNGTFTLVKPAVTATVAATTPQAYQANNSYANNGSTPVPAGFTITLNAPQATPTSVNFTLGGTAVNGVNYHAAVNGVNLTVGPTYTVVIPAGVTSVNVSNTPTATPVSGPTLTMTLQLAGGNGYSAVAPSSATAYIANSGPQMFTVDATVPAPTMYRGTPGDYAYFQVDRWGDTNVTITLPATAFSYSGTAVKGTDYTQGVSDVTFTAGAVSELETNGNPQLTSAFPYTYVGNETIIDTMTAGTSPESIAFTIGPSPSATLTLIDNANPPESVLYSNSLANASDTGWDLAFGSVGTGTAANPAPTVIKNYLSAAPNYTGDALHDYDVEIGFDLTTDTQITANPPNGSTKVLKMTVNKDPSVTYNNGTSTVNGASGAVNLYPADGSGNPLVFSGNYALRFSELDYEDGGSYATEFTECGINHDGTNANWWAGAYSGGAGNTNIDGVWYALGCDQGGAGFGDALEFTSSTYPNQGWTSLGSKSWTTFSTIFKQPPYNASGTGSPAVGDGANGALWNDVEIKQFNNIVTLSINKSVIYTYANTGLWKSGDVMLGYGDPFDSIGTGGRVYYSNVRVVRLSGPAITGVTRSGANLVITFTSNDTDATPASFGVLSSGSASGPWASTAATITQSGATYTATLPYSATGSQFFVIKQTDLVH